MHRPGSRTWLWLLLVLASGGAPPRQAGALEVGVEAPDFTLSATTGEKIRLRQFRGRKWVLIEFYVHDFGPT
jgi:cytochrome oxidase Cu insertion factor (SCO1/SenC/PrrC family)